MRMYAAQASIVEGHGRHGPSSGRRSVPTASVRLVHRPVRQRWCERPRCPALKVAPAPGDGVVHTIAGRARCQCPCTAFVRKKRAARLPVRGALFLRATHPTNQRARWEDVRQLLPEFSRRKPCQLRLHHRAFDSRAVLGVVNALRSASTRPRPGLRALTTPARGTTWAIARWPGF
jgi:hypothetical protein